MRLIRFFFIYFVILFSIVMPVLCQAGDDGAPTKNEVRPLTAQFASQQTIDGSNAIAVTFSAPLDAKQNLNRYLALFDPEDVPGEGGWVLSDDPQVVYFSNIEPGTTYAIEVHKGLKSDSGILLTESADFQVKTRPVEAMINFGSRGFILPASLRRGLPIHSVNIDQADIDFFRVDPAYVTAFIKSFGKESHLEYYRSKELNRYVELVYSGRWDLDIKKNLRTEINIPITHIEPLKIPGVYMAVLRGAGIYEYEYSATWFTISDLGLHVRKYTNAIQVQAQSLETAAPIFGAVIEAYNRKGFLITQVKSDTDGVAKLQGDFQDLKYIIARNHRHMTLLPMDFPAMDLSEFKAVTEALRPIDLFVYGPRDLYRPGETVVIDALLRKHDGLMTAALPLTAKVHRPDGRMVHEMRLKSRHLNYYHSTYLLPPDALTGSWRIEFSHAGIPLKPYRFTVAEFLPERMKLSLENPRDQGDRIGKNASLAIALKGDYLYGAPASNNKVDARIQLQPARELFPDEWPDFEFGHVTESIQQSFTTDPIKLDDTGRGILKIENQWEGIRSPAQLRATVSLYESGGRPVVRSKSWQVWPSGSLVGIRSLALDGEGGGEGATGIGGTGKSGKNTIRQVKGDSVAQFEVIAVDQGGKRLAVSGLKAVVIREHRDYYWEFRNDSWQWRYTRQFYPVEQFNVDIPADSAATVQVPVKWGGYRLELTHPETGLISSYRIWAGWRYSAGGWSEGGEEGSNRPDRVALSLDKAAYHPGDRVKVMVKAPEGGSGYLFVEADTNLLTRAVTVPPEGKRVELTLDPAWQRHDLYISALIVRPGEARMEAMPKRSVGLIHLPLDRTERRLALEIGVPEKIEPDQVIDIPVMVTSGEMHRSDIRVTLAAVDVGVLNLTWFETPSPWDYFFQPRRYGVELHDLYRKLIEAGKGAWAVQRFGGDAPGLSRGGDRPESDVRILSLHRQAVAVDGDGIAHFRLSIPDFNGAARFMAVAHSADAFGSAEKEVKVAAPMVVQIAMPRFLSMGDRSQLLFDLHNLSGMDQAVDVTIDTGSPVKIVGKTAHQITLKDGEKRHITVPVLGEQKIGRASIRCTVDGVMTPEGETRRIVKKWFLETRPAYPALTSSWRKTLKPGERFDMTAEINFETHEKGAVKTDLIDDTVTVQAGLSAFPPINISEHVRYLNAYPYGCLEQTTSGIYPHVLIGSADFAALGIKSQNDRQRMEKVVLGIQRLLEKQKSTGGFGLWQADDLEDYWLTAYVTDFLLNAREAGYTVPVDALSKALDRLLVYVRRGGTVKAMYYADSKHYPAAVRAYAAMVLARVRSLTLGDARSLYRAVKDDLKGPLGAVQAGIALYLAGDHTLAAEAFDNAIQIQREENRYYGDYGSQVRDAALAFYLLQTHCPGYGNTNNTSHTPGLTGGFKEASRFLFQLNDGLAQRRWLSTQERNALVMAGASIIRERGKMWEAAVRVGQSAHPASYRAVSHQGASGPSDTQSFGKTVDLKGDRLRQVIYSGPEAAAGFAITNTGKHDLFIDVAMNGYPAQKPDVESRGASIQRRYLSMDGNTLARELFHIKGGTVSQRSFETSDGGDSPERLTPSERLTSGRRMIVELRFRADERLPNGLVVDLLPACLELEDPSLAGSSAIDEIKVDGTTISKWHKKANILYTAYRDDRFAAAVNIERETEYRLFYAVRAVTPGEFLVPPPLIEDMYRPYIRGIGNAVALMPVEK